MPMQINGEGQNRILVQNNNTINASTVATNTNKFKQASCKTQFFGCTKHVTYIMSWRTVIKKNLLIEFSLTTFVKL